MKILAGGVKDTQKIRNKQGRTQNLSKAMTLGTNYRLFFRVAEAEDGSNDVVSATVLGRKLDFGKLGVSFVRIDDFDITDGGQYEDLTVLNPLSRVARVLHQAEFSYEKAKAEKEAIEEAKSLGLELDKGALAKKLREIELTYIGDRQAKPDPVYPKVNPMIGGKVQEAYTECYVVPLDKDGAPEFEKGSVAAFNLSSRKIKMLIELLNNKDYCPAGTQFLEAGWSWIGENDMRAGANATLQGISHDTALATKFPELWAANKDSLENLSKDAETIASKNMTLSSSTTPKEVQELMKKFMSKNRIMLTHINYEDETTQYTAQDILDSGIVDEVPTVKAKLQEVVETNKNSDTVATAPAEEGSALDALDKAQAEALTAAGSVKAIDATGAASALDGDDLMMDI